MLRLWFFLVLLVSGCEAIAQTPPVSGPLPPQVGASPINDPFTQLIVQLLGAGGIPAVLLGLLGYLIRGGGPTLNIRSAEPAVVKLDAPLIVQLSGEDREMLRKAAGQAENQAILHERTVQQRREVRRIRDVLHRHGNVLQLLADQSGINLNGVSSRRHSIEPEEDDADSEEPETDPKMRG